MSTINDLRIAVENKSARVLTIDLANELKGHKIATLYFGYRGQDGIDEFVVGDVVSELEYYRNLKEDCYINDPKGFKNRAEYWESYMTESQLSRYKNTMIIIAADGRNTFIRAHEENQGAFTCSDVDRFVYFLEVDPQVIFIDPQYNNGNFAVVSESEFLNRFKLNPGTEVLFEGPKCDVNAWVEDYCKQNNIEIR